jgi:hypothetical protein
MTLEHMAGHLIRRLHQRSAQVFQRRVQAAGLDLTQVPQCRAIRAWTKPGSRRRSAMTAPPSAV